MSPRKPARWLAMVLGGLALAVPLASLADSEWLAMANPAALACANAGGISLKTYDSKGEHSMCRLPSGKVCEEWAFFKGECTDSKKISPPPLPVPSDGQAPTNPQH
ncbi:MAG: DUF333 domain-containing protein [Limnohabitans sp.]